MSKHSGLFNFYFLGVALFAVQAFAAQSDIGNSLDREIERLQGFKSSTSGDLNASKACKKRFSKIFNKREVNISIGFGYGDSDNGDVAFDSLIYRDFAAKLTQPCPYGISACGFKRDRKDPDVFRRIVEAPTGENNYLMTIKITKPSLSINGIENTTVNLDKQMVKCQAAKAKFFGEIANGADVAFYIGHSRDGGGPDFCPAKRLANHHVNYSYYQKQKEGIKALVSAMKAAKASGNPNQVIASFSCSSELHFAKSLKAANPETGLILTSRTVTFHHMAMDAYTSLDSVLHQRCADGFNEAYEHRQFGTKLLNMF